MKQRLIGDGMEEIFNARDNNILIYLINPKKT